MKDWIREGELPELLGKLGVSHKNQVIHEVYYIEQGSPIRNISFLRDNIGFVDIKFHTEKVKL